MNKEHVWMELSYINQKGTAHCQAGGGGGGISLAVSKDMLPIQVAALLSLSVCVKPYESCCSRNQSTKEKEKLK